MSQKNSNGKHPIESGWEQSRPLGETQVSPDGRPNLYVTEVQTTQFQDYQQGIVENQFERTEMWGNEEEILIMRLETVEYQTKSTSLELQRLRKSEHLYKRRIRELENELSLKQKGQAQNVENQTSHNAATNLPELTGIPSVAWQELRRPDDHERVLIKRIKELEAKEEDFMESLHRADDLFAEREYSYRRQISLAEAKELGLRRKLKQLEAQLRHIDELKADHENLLNRLQTMERNEREFVKMIRVLESKNKSLRDDGLHLCQALQSVKVKLDNLKENAVVSDMKQIQKEHEINKCLRNEIKELEIDASEMENLYLKEVSALNTELNTAVKDLKLLQSVNNELKKNAKTLELKVVSLGQALEQKANEQTELIRMSNAIAGKDHELKGMMRQNQFRTEQTSRDEMSQALEQQVSIDTADTQLEMNADSVETLLETIKTLDQELKILATEKERLQEQVAKLEKQNRCQFVEKEKLKFVVLHLRRKLKSEETDSSELDLKATIVVLQQKCSIKNRLITVLADDIRNRFNDCSLEDLIKKLAKTRFSGAPPHDFDRQYLCQYLRSKHSSPSRSCNPPCTTIEVSQHSNRTAPRFPSMSFHITRTVGSNALLMSWKVPPSNNVASYEIYVNGFFAHKVYSRSRNQALLQGLNLSTRLVIFIFAFTSRGQVLERDGVIFQGSQYVNPVV